MGKRKSDVWDEPQTYRLLGLDAREPDETDDEKFLRRLDENDWERAADRVEQASIGWEDWRGFPLEGFESPVI